MLVVVQDYLENTLLFQSVILVLLTVRFEGVDWSIELFFGVSLGIDNRCSEEDIECTFQSLGNDFEDLGLT